jgi:hypothetical protein
MDSQSTEGRVDNFQELLAQEETNRLAALAEKTAKRKEYCRKHSQHSYRKKRIAEQLAQAMKSPNKHKTPQERLLDTVEKGHEQEDKEMDMLANTHHRDNEAKQAAQNQLMQRQNKLDADRDASRATLEAQVENKKQKRTEELQVVLEVMRLLPAPEAALPPPLGTPSSLQAMTPASVSSRESSRASSRSASRGTSPTRDILSLGQRKMSPIDEDKVKSTASKLKSQLEAMSPELSSSGTAGGTMSLYTASVNDIRHGTAKLSLEQVGLTGVEAIVQIGDCTVLLSYGIINHYTPHETVSNMLFGATKPTGDAIDELCNVDRIFGGGRIIVAFCGDTAHWFQYKGQGFVRKDCRVGNAQRVSRCHWRDNSHLFGKSSFLEKGCGLAGASL